MKSDIVKIYFHGKEGILMRVVFGMPTLIELSDISDNFELCKELGLKFIEINMNLPQYQIDTFPIERCKKLMDKYNIFITIHLDENLNICDFNRAVANAYLDTVLSTIDIAKELSAPIINMHLSKGVYFTLPNEKIFLYEKYCDFYLETMTKFRSKCETAIETSDISICIENCDMFYDFQKTGIEMLLESPVFGLTHDIGHDYSAGNINENFIIKHMNRLMHMHIHDATRTKNHLILGTGEIDMQTALQVALQNNCRCVLETKTVAGLQQSVLYLKQVGFI